MESGRAARLFHGIVVIGAALGANRCGGVVVLDDAEDGGLSDSGSQSPAQDALQWPDAAQRPDAIDVAVPPDAQYGAEPGCDARAGDADSRDAATAWQPATHVYDCVYSAQYLCMPSGCYCNLDAPMTAEDCADSSTFSCMNVDGHREACICTTISTPEQCDHPQQLWCSDNRCVCDPGAPLSACECEHGASFWCASYDPPTSCYCQFVILR